MPAEGTGSRRRFTFRDAALGLLVRKLKRAHLPMDRIRTCLDALQQHWTDDNPEHAGWIVVNFTDQTETTRWCAPEAEFLVLLGGPDARAEDVLRRRRHDQGDDIAIHGDQRDKVAEKLHSLGYKVKLAGG